jgi:hypothetical protein
MRTVAVFLFLVACALPPGVAQTPPQAPSPAPGTPAPGAAPQAAPASKPAAPAGPDLGIPTDTSTQWTVGFTVFTAVNLSPENAYLASSIPLLLRDEVSSLSTHSFSADEAATVRAAIVAKAIDAADKGVTAVRKEHDTLFFSGTVLTDAAEKASADKLRFALARVAFLQALDTSQVVVPANKPIRVAVGTGQGNLLDAPDVPPSVYCARQGLDLLVSGTIQEVQGYLLVDVWAYHAARGSLVIQSRDAALREELYVDLPEISAELTTTVLGRDWSLVTFSPQPAQASLFVDGTLRASGAAPALYLDPGERQVRISAPGYQDVTRTVTLEKGATIRIDDALEETRPATIAVSTDPEGATLYVDSRWQGVTPLTIPRPAERGRGVLDLDGHYSVALDLGPGTGSQLSVTMPRDVGPRDVQQAKARDDFYAAFGWFAVSIPIPLFSYALVFDFAVQENNFVLAGQLTAAAGADGTRRAFLASYYGGVALSAALFTWMVFRIINYVAVANGIAG